MSIIQVFHDHKMALYMANGDNDRVREFYHIAKQLFFKILSTKYHFMHDWEKTWDIFLVFTIIEMSHL